MFSIWLCEQVKMWGYWSFTVPLKTSESRSKACTSLDICPATQLLSSRGTAFDTAPSPSANWLQLRKALVYTPCLFKIHIKAWLSESKSKLQNHIREEFSHIHSSVCRHSSRHDFFLLPTKIRLATEIAVTKNKLRQPLSEQPLKKPTSVTTYLVNTSPGIWNKESLRVYWTANCKYC